MSRESEWLTHLLLREKFFNQEVHLLGSGRKRVECLGRLGQPDGGGWLLTFSDTEAGEWNMARAFGNREMYQRSLREFPPGVEFHLLVPREESNAFHRETGSVQNELLIWFEDPNGPACGKGDPDGFSSTIPPGYVLKFREENAQSPFDWSLNGFLLENDSIVSLVKTTHATPRTVEVYIETFPQVRDRGLGAYLLARFIERVRAEGKTLIYVVSAENGPSLRIAGKLGLIPFQELVRIPFKNHHFI